MQNHNLPCDSFYHNFISMKIRVCGLTENIKKRGLILILGVGTTLKG